jgi:hypothetical protein
MRKLIFTLIVVCAGCYDLCHQSCPDHASSGGCASEPNCDCLRNSELPRKNGTSCKGSHVGFCTDGNWECTCDPASLVWHCALPDLAIPRPPDLALPVVKGDCTAYRDCIVECFQNPLNPNTNYATCRTFCTPKVGPGAVAKYEAALACGQAHCLGDADAGGSPCVLDVDGDTLLNEDGTPIAATDPGTGLTRCGACLDDSLAELFGAACSDLNSPDCNPSACQAATQACLLD